MQRELKTSYNCKQRRFEHHRQTPLSYQVLTVNFSHKGTVQERVCRFEQLVVTFSLI